MLSEFSDLLYQLDFQNAADLEEAGNWMKKSSEENRQVKHFKSTCCIMLLSIPFKVYVFLLLVINLPIVIMIAEIEYIYIYICKVKD